MKFLVDENVPSIIVQWLKDSGFDVVEAGAISAGAEDLHWLQIADAEQRIIITADKDFGELVFRDKLNTHGIILMRLFDQEIEERLSRIQEVWSVVEANPKGRFVVITSKRIRVRLIT